MLLIAVQGLEQHQRIVFGSDWCEFIEHRCHQAMFQLKRCCKWRQVRHTGWAKDWRNDLTYRSELAAKLKNGSASIQTLSTLHRVRVEKVKATRTRWITVSANACNRQNALANISIPSQQVNTAPCAELDAIGSGIPCPSHLFQGRCPWD